MTKRMLIDATHAEETRVVVLDGSHIEDYDVESATKKQLKGNIYLAKVVRVEPSLQAAFVEYGGNRHGFLAFDEIHPDYYQIPIADREKLLALQEAEEQAAAAAEDLEASRPAARIPTRRRFAEDPEGDRAETGPGTTDAALDAVPGVAVTPEDQIAADASFVTDGASAEDAPGAEAIPATAVDASADDGAEPEPSAAMAPAEEDEAPETPPETLGGDQDGAEELHPARISRHFLRQYKIQEVIHRRQIILVQVVKEERGLKGAALTTYISLAGRYCVLMPNSPRGGGVSRKITALGDRKRLKEVITELAIPAGMGLIVRTAGASRPKPEIKRDCEYLLRLWDEIRETVMKSVAPALVYEEASLIKRAIRDVYSRDIEEVLVDGEAAWQAAHEFMRTLMPTHASKVVLWQNGGQSLFSHERVEAELDATLSPTVPLRSGGSLVINQAEALVAIDVNSGRSTRERNIEETALRTNLEAAEEVGRQLRLRDLAGLIVIDFIDMEVRKHNAMVERRLKEALKGDRARVQVGRISHFGLLEMSRQRLHSSLDETSFLTCPHCGGTGHVRSVESGAVHLLRALEDEAAKKGAGELVVHAANETALYVLNHKRSWLAEIEKCHDVVVSFDVEPGRPDSEVAIERLRSRPSAAPKATAAEPAESETVEASAPGPAPNGAEEERREARIAEDATGEAGEDRERRHRRRRRRRRHDEAPEASTSTPATSVSPAGSTTVPPELAEQPEVVAPAAFAAEATAPAVREARPPREAGRRPPRRGPRDGEARRRRTPRSPARDAAIAIELPIEAATPPQPSQPEPAAERDGDEPTRAPILAPPAPVPEPPAAPALLAAEPLAATDVPAMAERPPIDDRPPAPAVVPVVVGSEQEKPAPKKRGWWRG